MVDGIFPDTFLSPGLFKIAVQVFRASSNKDSNQKFQINFPKDFFL